MGPTIATVKLIIMKSLRVIFLTFLMSACMIHAALVEPIDAGVGEVGANEEDQWLEQPFMPNLSSQRTLSEEEEEEEGTTEQGSLAT